jgi:peptide-methionine (R)-S-oxide reductase
MRNDGSSSSDPARTGGPPLSRGTLLAGLAGAAALAYVLRGHRALADTGSPATYEVTHSDAEWRKLLTPEQYDVLRKEGTEFAFSSPLDHEFGKGTYYCVGCSLALFSSKTKFDSGTGWPSFYAPLPHAVLTRDDSSLGMERTEVHCRRCGGHLGHVFDDGPKPTGLRYCMNGVALRFEPAKS